MSASPEHTGTVSSSGCYEDRIRLRTHFRINRALMAARSAETLTREAGSNPHAPQPGRLEWHSTLRTLPD